MKLLGAKVTLIDAEGNTTTAFTNNEGQVIFENLTTQIFDVKVEKHGYESTTIQDVNTKISQSLDIQLKEGVNPDSRTLEVHVKPENINARVMLKRTDEEAIYDDVTVIDSPEKDGLVTFEDIPFGAYTLTVSGEGYKTLTQEITINNNNNNPRICNLTLEEDDD